MSDGSKKMGVKKKRLKKVSVESASSLTLNSHHD